jgi:hypothetical protein
MGGGRWVCNERERKLREKQERERPEIDSRSAGSERERERERESWARDGVGRWAPVVGRQSVDGGGTVERGRFGKWGEILEMNLKCRTPAFSTLFF